MKAETKREGALNRYNKRNESRQVRIAKTFRIELPRSLVKAINKDIKSQCDRGKAVAKAEGIIV